MATRVSKDRELEGLGIEEFWERTLEQTASEPLDETTEHVAEPLPYETFRVTYRSFGGVYARARLSKPIDRSTPPRLLPAIITAPGYGGREQGIMLSECQRSYIILQIFPRG